jgi:hypothetical protein
VFAPVRARWQGTGSGSALDAFGNEPIATQLARFLDGEVRELMLGPMVAALQRALHHGPASEDPADRLLLDWAVQLPNPAPLFPDQPQVRKRRARALEHVRMLRNRCAHPQAPPAREELTGMWTAVVDDPEDAFYQYFGRAFLAGEQGPAPKVAEALGG